MLSDSDHALFEFLVLVECTNIALSLAVNILLVYLILYRSPREIGAYRHLLLAFALNDIYFPLVHLLTLPVICSYKDAFIMFANGLLTSRFAISFFGATFSQTMPLLAHLFVYRLTATKWPHRLPFYTPRTCFLLIAVTLGVENPVWFLHCYYNGYDEETGAYVQPFLVETFNGEGTQFIGALYYSSSGHFRLSAFLTTMGFNAIMGVCITVIIYCSYATIAHLRSSLAHWSAKTRQLQQQLFYTLIVQMLVPMLLVYFPCAGIINLPLFGFRLSVFPNLVSASLTLFPLIDAFIVMFGVRAYRLHVLALFKSATQPAGNNSFTVSHTNQNGARISITVSTH